MKKRRPSILTNYAARLRPRMEPAHVGRLTFNLGARYDKFNAFIPAQSVPDSNFVRGFSIDKIAGTPNWNDWATRTGVAWDVFGNGKTAVKAFAGRFVAGEAFSRTAQFNPIYSRSDTRSWTDLNGDGKILNPDQSVQFNEIGPGSANFGSPDTVDKQDPDLKRDKNWTYELTAQQALTSRIQVFGGYYRRHFYDLAWTDNRATANFVDANNPGDWIPFTYIGPSEPRLPNGGGEAITLYNLRAPLGTPPALPHAVVRPSTKLEDQKLEGVRREPGRESPRSYHR